MSSPQGGREGRGRAAHRPGAVSQVLGTVAVAMVLRQLRGRVAVLIPQGGVHAVGQQGLAALRGAWGADTREHRQLPAPPS